MILRLFTLLHTAFTRIVENSIQISENSAQISNNTSSIKKISAACCARGSVSSLTLSAGTKTTVPLNTWISRTDTSFTFSSNGIKMPYDGTVLISGSNYINGGTNIACGTYIQRSGVELSSEYITTSTGGVATGACIITVSSGDVINLVARRSAAGTCVPNNAATYLSILYLS